MGSARWRPLLISLAAIVGLWLVALSVAGYAKNRRMTAEKFIVYAESVQLDRLSGEARARTLRELADRLNRLSLEERRRARMDGAAFRVFNQMTDEEKAGFIEATLPTGFKQMLASFEQMPEDRRKRAVDDALRNLRNERARAESGEDPGGPEGTNGPPVLSPELEAKVRSLGLQAFYSQSSAATKAELAPVLEELQRLMESGRPFGPRHGH
jgi:hypothetical protein